MSFQLFALPRKNLRRVPTTPNIFWRDDLSLPAVAVILNVMAVTKRIPPLEMRRNFANSALNQFPHIPQMSLGRQNVPQTDAHNSATV
jgi:hypothetical protein